MNRRDFVTCCGALAARPLDRLALGRKPTSPRQKLRPERFNLVCGANNCQATYGFTGKTRLVETANVLREMNSNIVKLALGAQTLSAYNLPANPEIGSLESLVRDEPSVRAVFDMPFTFYVLWAREYRNGDNSMWNRGLSPEDKERAYNEMYRLARHLLKLYSKSGKQFYLGHWEGDWSLLNGFDPEAEPHPQGAQGMAEWLNARHQAIEDARRDEPHEDVAVWSYATVNLVKKAMGGRTGVTNDVLPHANVDYVGYSSYDAQHSGQALRAALDHIEAKLRPKPSLAGRRVFLDEYGHPLDQTKTPQEQDRRSRVTMRAALEWGCPFALYWQAYCNEIVDGRHRGFWLVDDKNRRQPIFRTHQKLLRQSRAWVDEFVRARTRLPTHAEYSRQAVRILDAMPAA